MKNRERRAFSFEIRAEENEKHGHFITGRPIVYGQMTDIGFFDEVIEPGALDNADLRDVAFLVNHNMDSLPLARSRRNNENSTMQLIPDEEGLMIRVDLDTENNADARSLYSAVQRGDISGMSFCFWADEDKWDELGSEHPTRHVLKIGAVCEVSAVTWPAYEQTTIEARGQAEALESAKAALERAIEERRAEMEEAEAERRRAEAEARKRRARALALRIRMEG